LSAHRNWKGIVNHLSTKVNMEVRTVEIVFMIFLLGDFLVLISV